MAESIQNIIQSNYGAVATSDLSSDHEGVRAVAQAFGYTDGELEAIPAEANMGLSCGNPTAFASIRPGEIVVDLGCGGGLDVFLAGQKVGPNGRAIGIDMTPEMIGRAKANAAKGIGGKPIENVEFHLATIDRLPLPDASVDVVISNCVINLASDKPAVFREIFRVLKPGGRVAVSDIVLKKALPEELATNMAALVGCISGAIPIEEYQSGLKQAGFSQVHVTDTGSDLNAYAKVEGQAACCAPPMTSKTLPVASSSCCGGDPCTETQTGVHAGIIELLKKYNVNEFAASARIYAVKPK